MLTAAFCRDVRLLLLEPSRWSVVQKYGSIVKGLTLDQLLAFVRALKAELYAEGLVQGNFTSAVSTHTLAGFQLAPSVAAWISSPPGLHRSPEGSCGASWSEYPAGQVLLNVGFPTGPVLCSALQFRPPPAEVPVSFQVVELPPKHHLCKVKSLNKGDANSEVTVYYQVGGARLRPGPEPGPEPALMLMSCVFSQA